MKKYYALLLLIFFMPHYTQGMIHSFKSVTKLTSKKTDTKHIKTKEELELENDWRTKSKPLNVVLLLDTNGSEYYDFKKDPYRASVVTFALHGAISQKIPFIASAHLLYILKHCKNPAYVDSFKQLSTSDWMIYGDNTKSFVVAFPKDYSADLPLSYVGINDKKVKYIPSLDFNKYAEKSLPLVYFSINTDNLKALFVNPYARKRIYLCGHGLYSPELLSSFVKKAIHISSYSTGKATVASLSSDQYLSFLTFLNSQGTDLVYVSSCYAGGYNLLLYQKLDELITKIPLSYFLLIGATTDAAISVFMTEDNIINFQDFFKNIDSFFEPSSKTPASLEAIVQSFKYDPTSIPSVRFPGSIDYFKALNINNKIEIITYAKALAHTLKIEPANRSYQPAMVKKEIQPFDIKDKRAVLIYPLYVATPLYIHEGIFTPSLISMVPGNTFHILKQVKIGGMSQLYQLFLQMESISEKVFMIEKLETKSYSHSGLPSGILEKVMIDIKPKSQQPKSIIIVQVEGNFYQAENGINFQPMDTNQAKEIISKTLKDIKDKTLQRAVNQATGGREDVEEIYKKAIKIFVPKSPEEREVLLKKKQEKHERLLAEKEQALQRKRERIEKNKSPLWIGY